MTKLYFVRHAQSDYTNHDERSRPLSEQGLKDRELVTRFLRDKNISVLLSSPYRRSMDTLRPFAEENRLTFQLCEDWRERKIENEWIEDFEAFSARQWQDFDYKLPGGESLRQVQERNIRAVGEALTLYEGKNIAIGTHGTALSTILCYYQPGFGYADFQRILPKMPWVVCLHFEKQTYLGQEEWDLT